jgi:hypothetical protein
MSDVPEDPDARETRRSRLIGRAILIGFGLLLLIYLAPLFLDRIGVL